jgi:hypothetical protein
LWMGDIEKARDDVNACRAQARQIEWREAEAECELLIGELDLESGTPDCARERFTRSLTICCEVAGKSGEATALWWLAKVDLEDRAFTSARMRLSKALLVFRASQMNEELLGCVEDHAYLAQAQDMTHLAVHLMAAAAAARQRLGLSRSPRDKRRWQARIDSLRLTATNTAFDTSWSEGQAWSVEQAVRMAMPERGESSTALLER